MEKTELLTAPPQQRNLMEKRNSAETAHATGRLFQEQKLKSSHLYINKNEGLLLQASVVTGNYKGGVQNTTL